MPKAMKFFFAMFCGAMSVCVVSAQEKGTYESGHAAMMKGDYENAISQLSQAQQQDPDNIDIQKDLSYAYYLTRDYSKAIEIGKKLADSRRADADSYQRLGLYYRAIADYKSAHKLFDKGVKKFPNSGVLYNSYGEMLAEEKNTDAAIRYWEKGIQQDPNISGNYFNAAHYYDKTGDLLWAALYGEIFLNMESLSNRTIEMKTMVLNDYEQLFNNAAILDKEATRGGFTAAVASGYIKYRDLSKQGVNPETLTAIRTRFITDWFGQNAAQYPFRLFDHQRQLLQEGSFDAYNQWIFSSASPAAYQSWTSEHATENGNFLKLQRSKMFKVPAGQYYPH